MEHTTISCLQKYIKAKDYRPNLVKDYFLKLSEEVGELANAIRKNEIQHNEENIKGTINEELWDVIYYAIAIANCYDIDLEKAIKEKEKINNIKYKSEIIFESGK